MILNSIPEFQKTSEMLPSVFYQLINCQDAAPSFHVDLPYQTQSADNWQQPC